MALVVKAAKEKAAKEEKGLVKKEQAEHQREKTLKKPRHDAKKAQASTYKNI